MVDRRRGAERRGRRAEILAAWWLRLHAYSILEMRFKCPLGEIDIVARRGNMLVFVEVKQRPTLAVAETAVPDQAWLRIARAADAWIARHSSLQSLNRRYDLIAIAPRHWPKHCRDYWRP